MAGGFAAVLVGAGGVDGGERVGEKRYAEGAGMESGQSLACDQKGSSLFRDCSTGDLRSETFFRDAAEIAGAFDRAAAVRRVSCFLFAATGGAEFVSNEPVAGLL